MRILKIILITFILGGLLTVPMLSCASESDSVASEDQIVTVQRGDLRIDITAVGNLSLSLKEDLAFEISGTVEEVLVEEGDTVKEGQVLAKLDTSEWDKELIALESDLLQAQMDLQKKENQKYDLELALLNAEINLETAYDNLFEAQDDYSYGSSQEDIWELKVDKAKLEKAQAQADLAEEVTIYELQVKLAEMRFEDAEKALEEALNASPGITAPFDGFITRVNVSGGDEVKKGTVAVQLADPTKFEAELLVSEMDIFQVKLGGEAWVQVDAMPGMSLPAKVTHISPTATIQQGVVNYRVKVEVESLEAVMQEQQQARQDISSGELPEQLKKAIEEGLITQEQAEEMMKQRQQGQGGQQGQMPAMIAEDFQLREGLTVTVNIIVEERNDVLLVPNAAITRQGMETYVQVVSPDSVIEERSITTGISDWQYTEVISGLSEGEKVVIPQGTTTTPMTPQQGEPPIRIPGMGRM